jgi:peptidylprolyl isomerase
MSALAPPLAGRRGPGRLIVALLLAGSVGAYVTLLDHHGRRATATAASSPPVLGVVTRHCAAPASPVTGFATLSCPSPAMNWGSPSPLTIPSTPPPATLAVGDLISGDGPEARVGDRLIVQYEMGTYSTHRIVQSSWWGQPYTFNLGSSGVVAGFDRALVGMRAGGRREIILPPALGYGDRTPAAGIARHDTLVFVVDLFKIN